MTRLRCAESDEGFTLVELLVVVIIIGLLTALAVPVFLGQRRKGYDAAARNDLRNLANFEEIYLTDYGSYGPIATIQVNEPKLTASPGVTLSVVRYSSLIGYCLSAKHASSDSTLYWDSQAGGLQPAGSPGCPVTLTGASGDSITG